ncbi:large subunit ribosomal protein L28 [Marchantia polymorpha subsp. ruderalis]|uniref:Large ribosomal subunit protein bL28m n=2 Tax=Marchantia polymorpha TaxID=3197 RepID=A0A176VNR9_MARPO|nr:hypothetical protein AXG93_731s1030 [Marchantia polymorpha subsp. ruderalis]PTQ43098.1 hypothetical protein MARPO_0026s0002 [Marchantia polymorpha]BBN02220.1 hypothetical protein Mp_2g13690 [Marchantia polymorpha subsp. ruderalis]|eukprot:PTQ43098.1 hypothetical protein MARPO_0026s0002 [Marchantia polymorpha]
MSTRVVTIMNRAKRGLYAGRHIQFGNKVSEDGGNKSRRTWKPNVQSKRVFSLALDKYIRVHITTHALRCIDKAGGIDEYLLNIPDRNLESDIALFWKNQIAAVYQRLANIEIAIPVQKSEDSAFSMKVYGDALSGVGDGKKSGTESLSTQ